jgi:hypothetical protein
MLSCTKNHQFAELSDSVRQTHVELSGKLFQPVGDYYFKVEQFDSSSVLMLSGHLQMGETSCWSL